MRSAVRRAAVISVGLVLAAALTVAVLLWTFDPEPYRDTLMAAASRAAGRTITLDGPIELEKSLTPALSLSGLRISGDNSDAAAPLARIERLEARLRLLPLLQRRVEIVRFVVHGAHFNLARDARGRGNWPTATPTADRGPQTHPATRLALDIETVRFEGLHLSYRAGPEEPAQQVTIQALDLRPGGHEGVLELAAHANFSGLDFELDGQVPSPAALTAESTGRFDLTLQAADLRLSANGTISPADDTPTVDAEIELRATGMRAIERLAGIELAGIEPPTIRAHIQVSDDRIRAEPLSATIGDSEIGGSVEISTAHEPPRLKVKTSSPLLDLADFGIVPEAEAAPADAPLVPALALNPTWLDAFDFRIEADLAAVRHTPHTFKAVQLILENESGVLQVDTLQGRLGDGRFDAAMKLRHAADPPRLTQHFALRDLRVAPLLDKDNKGDFKGGLLNIDVAIEGSGHDLRTLASRADGLFEASLSDLRLHDGALGAATGDALLGIINALNPFNNESGDVFVECAAARFPIERGVLRSDTGLGLRTRRLRVLGGGAIDLVDESLDLGFDVKPRSGIGLNAASLTDFVRIGGTLRAPKPVTDARGAAVAGVKTGAAIATMGLSLVAEGLLDRAAEDVDVCAVAAGDVPPPDATVGERAAGSAKSAAKSAAETAGGAIERAGSAIKEGFRSLFSQ